MAPILKMFTLGHILSTTIHFGGLRYHGMAPQILISNTTLDIEAVCHPQLESIRKLACCLPNRRVLPAPESSHAIRAAIDRALDAKEKTGDPVQPFGAWAADVSHIIYHQDTVKPAL